MQKIEGLGSLGLGTGTGTVDGQNVIMLEAKNSLGWTLSRVALLPWQRKAPRAPISHSMSHTMSHALASESQPWQGLYNSQIDLAIEQLFC
jgi:hypothetical protein